MQPARRSSSATESSSSLDSYPPGEPQKKIKVIEKPKDKYGEPSLLPFGVKTHLSESKVESTALMLLGGAETTCRMHGESESSLREKTYRKENKALVKSTTKKTALTVIKTDAKKNSKAMGISVGVGAALGCVGFAGGPIGGAIGVSVGSTIGFFVGGVYIKNNITKKINIQIFTSDHYTKWRADAVIQKVFPIFKNFLDADDQFEDFFCPISQDIISIPMKAPDGKTYEKDMIEGYLLAVTKDAEKKCESPIRGKSFSRSELVFDLTYCQNLIVKTQEVYKKVKEVEGNYILKYGLEAVQKNTKQTIDSLYTSVKFHYFNELSIKKENRNMTLEQLEAKVKKECAQWDWNF